MIRFITDKFEDTCVVSVGGAKLLDSLGTLVTALGKWNVVVVIFHTGTNNVNKTYLPEESQMARAVNGLQEIENTLIHLQAKFGFAFVFLGSIYKRSFVVNKRIDKLNELVRSMCKKYGYKFVDNSNISPCTLQDQVHLNEIRQKALLENLKGLL